MQGFFVLGQIALWIATITAIISAIDYSRRINGLFAAPSADRPRGAASEPSAAAAPTTRGRLSA
jgi:hypothetical protein